MVVFATLKDDVLREARATQRVKLRQEPKLIRCPFFPQG
jgi:hypothetical protein